MTHPVIICGSVLLVLNPIRRGSLRLMLWQECYVQEGVSRRPAKRVRCMRGHGTRMYRMQHQQEDNGQDEVQDALEGSEDAAERNGGRLVKRPGTKEIGNGCEERGGGPRQG